MWLAYGVGVTNGQYARYWTKRKLDVSQVQQAKRAITRALSRLSHQKSEAAEDELRP